MTLWSSTKARNMYIIQRQKNMLQLTSLCLHKNFCHYAQQAHFLQSAFNEKKMSPSKDEEDGVSEESNAVLHATDDLLSHPLGDVHIPHQYHHRSRDKPQSVEAEEGVVEPTLRNTYAKVINCDPCR